MINAWGFALVFSLASTQQTASLLDMVNLQANLYSYYIKYHALRAYSAKQSHIATYCQDKGPLQLNYDVVFEMGDDGKVEQLHILDNEGASNCLFKYMAHIQFPPPPSAPFYLRVSDRVKPAR